MSRAPTARLFVAIDPPAPIRHELAAWARLAVAGLRGDERPNGARTVRLLEPETMHLTLCFLGSRPVAELAGVVAAVEGLTASGGELALGAPLWLPPRRPRTLALTVHDRSGELARLHEAVAQAVSSAIAWQPERRRFRAHVTVARLGRERSRGRQSSPTERALPPTPQLSFTAREVVLYRSWLAPGGASYEALTARSLDASSKLSSGEEGSGPEPAAP
ncbi:MAG TPA: RNA 2',3'-cyclic phosphodiesterase [Solirubrobacteraceae bacterium]|nr:RNA 2',3'-cyclic phosphodiesterase [Solirubrobacteraceae bacterium]